MTTTATATPPTALEMARTVTELMSKSVAEGGDAADARARLAAYLEGSDAPLATAARAEEKKPEVALTIEGESVDRPNGEKYFLRKIGNHTDVAALRAARKSALSALAYGPPGTGKTALMEAAFGPEEQGGLWTVQGTGDTETADFIGGYVQTADGRYLWVDGPLILAMEAGGALFVDEVALIDPKVLAVLYSVMDGRGELVVTANPERGVIKAKKGFYVIAACNPNAPGARMSEALISRFPLQFLVTTDFGLANRLGVPAKLRTAAQNMQKKVEKGELGWSPQLRELLAFKKIAEILGEDVALQNLVAGSPELDRPSVEDIVARTYSRKTPALRLD